MEVKESERGEGGGILGPPLGRDGMHEMLAGGICPCGGFVAVAVTFEFPENAAPYR
jgi:hypothetical protein